MQGDKLDWCLAKETRMKRVRPDRALAKKHVQKAKHNLLAMDYSIRGGFGDWAVSQSYYAMYHALLAVLFKAGFESRNHECTITAVESLTSEGKTGLERRDIAFIRTTGQMTRKDAKALREEFQYGTETEVNTVLLGEMVRNAKAIVEKIEIALQEG